MNKEEEIIQATPYAANIIYKFQNELKKLGEATKKGDVPNMEKYREALDELLVLMRDAIVVTGFGETTNVYDA